VERTGRFGPFIGCSGYPECRYIKKEAPKTTGVTCPKCKEGELVERRGRFGIFFSCSRYPDCDFSLNQRPLPEPCPACQGLVVEARGGARRCTSCGRAWDAEGNELSDEEAKALIPKGRGTTRSGSRARKSSSARSRGSGSSGGSRAKDKRTA
jgi:DNA topoisomerase-1